MRRGDYMDGDQLAQAGVAIAGLQSSMLSVACAVQEFSISGGPVELHSSAEALRRSALQLDGRLTELYPIVSLNPVSPPSTSATAATVSGADNSRSVCPVGAVSTTIRS